MASSISKLVQRMGTGQALRMYAMCKLAGGPFTVQMPEYAQALWVRPRTSDRNMFADVLLDREYELAMDPPPAFIIDAGANVGYTSVFMANRYPGAQIIAIEPEASNFAMLEKNTAHLPQVKRVKAGLWSRPTHLYVENPDDVKSGYRMAECDESQPGAIRATTILELMAQHGVSTVDICKIDIEGGETEVFSAPDVDQWLSRTRVLILELHERFRPQAGEIVRRALARHPHRVAPVGDNLFFTFER